MNTLNEKLELEVVKTGLIPERAKPLLDLFRPLAKEAVELFLTADTVKETEPKKARQTRLALRSVRCEVEKLRKEEKAESLKQGKAIDQVAGIIFDVITPYERAMDAIERAEEIAAQKVKEERAVKRRAEIAPYGTAIDDLFILEMNEQAWSEFVEGAKIAFQKRQEAEAKAKAEEEAKQRELAKLREENASLRREAENAARDRLKAEAMARQVQASSAPITKGASEKEALLGLVQQVRAIKCPEVKSGTAKDILREFSAALRSATFNLELSANNEL